MSTRCQVLIKSDSKEFEDDILLYHHCDGQPSNMISVIAKAFRWGHRKTRFHRGGELTDYYRRQLYRVGSIAAYLCHQDPRGFEVENNRPDLQGDIEWYYEIEIGGTNRVPYQWKVTIYKAIMQEEGPPKLHLALSNNVLLLVTLKSELTSESKDFIAKKIKIERKFV